MIHRGRAPKAEEAAWNGQGCAINARDAMPNGGVLSIALSNAEVTAEVVSDLSPGKYVLLAVEDTGVGMDEATLARATEPFFTTKEAGRGTGLGLAMMQAIVTQCGGATQLQSEVGRGTRVTLWLPRATSEALEGAPHRHALPPAFV